MTANRFQSPSKPVAITFAAIATIALAATQASAAATFNFTNTANTGSTSFQVANSSDAELGTVTATVAVTSDQTPATPEVDPFNVANDGLGIGTASTTEEAGNLGNAESFTITFDTAVTLDSVLLNNFSTNPVEILSFDIPGSTTLDGQFVSRLPAVQSQSFDFAEGITVAANSPILFAVGESGVGGNARFRFTSITVSAVPEPATLGLLAVLPALGLRRPRRA